MMQLSAISEVAKGYMCMNDGNGRPCDCGFACLCVCEFLCRFSAGGFVHIHMEVQVRKSNYKCINLSQNAESRM